MCLAGVLLGCDAGGGASTAAAGGGTSQGGGGSAAWAASWGIEGDAPLEVADHGELVEVTPFGAGWAVRLVNATALDGSVEVRVTDQAGGGAWRTVHSVHGGAGGAIAVGPDGALYVLDGLEMGARAVLYRLDEGAEATAQVGEIPAADASELTLFTMGGTLFAALSTAAGEVEIHAWDGAGAFTPVLSLDREALGGTLTGIRTRSYGDVAGLAIQTADGEPVESLYAFDGARLELLWRAEGYEARLLRVAGEWVVLGIHGDRSELLRPSDGAQLLAPADSGDRWAWAQSDGDQAILFSYRWVPPVWRAVEVTLWTGASTTALPLAADGGPSPAGAVDQRDLVWAGLHGGQLHVWFNATSGATVAGSVSLPWHAMLAPR